MKILIDRFIKNSGMDVKYFSWDDEEYLSLEDIDNAIKNGITEISEPFGHPSEGKKHRDINYHIRRIVYFINHPKEIKGLEIGYHYHGCKGIYSYCVLVDGFHRLAAAIYLGFKEIDIVYEGRQDVLDYLTGKRKRQPWGTNWKWAE